MFQITASIILIGLLLTLLLIRLLAELYREFRRKRFKWHNSGDQWAVITGATDGIGFEFARQLAQRGYHLLLISRSEDKLRRTEKTIIEDLRNAGQKPISIRTLVADFTRTDIYERIEEFLSPDAQDIFVLVNNVGAAPEIPDVFVREDRAHHQELINVNVIATTKMIEIVLPSLVSKKRGLIINVSAIWARHLAPMWSIHAASKAYIGHLGECLAEECGPAGVTICTLYTAGVSTKMAYNVAPSMFIATPRAYVRSVLGSIRNAGGYQSTGYWSHQLTHIGMRALSALGTKHATASFLGWFSRKYRALLIARLQNSALEINARNLLNARASGNEHNENSITA